MLSGGLNKDLSGDERVQIATGLLELPRGMIIEPFSL